MAIRSVTVASTTLMVITFIFYIVSNAVPVWSKISISNGEITEGLWKSCATKAQDKRCYDVDCSIPGLPDTCRKLQIARAFVTLACIFSGFSIISLILCMVMRDKVTGVSLIAIKGLVFLCFIMALVGTIMGVIRLYSDSSIPGLELGAAAIMGILGLIVNLCGAIATAFIKP